MEIECEVTSYIQASVRFEITMLSFYDLVQQSAYFQGYFEPTMMFQMEGVKWL